MFNHNNCCLPPLQHQHPYSQLVVPDAAIYIYIYNIRNIINNNNEKIMNIYLFNHNNCYLLHLQHQHPYLKLVVPDAAIIYICNISNIINNNENIISIYTKYI